MSCSMIFWSRYMILAANIDFIINLGQSEIFIMHPIATVPSLSELKQLLQDLQLNCSASEMHGLAGLLAGGVRLNRQLGESLGSSY